MNHFFRLIAWPPMCPVDMSNPFMRRTQIAVASTHTAEDHRDEEESLQQALQHHCAVEKNQTGVITTQLTLRHGQKPQHLDASARTRQALKRRPVANGHSCSARQTFIGGRI